ncbi:glycoside hydrolase family 18 protein [Tundrisphaera sp. TA3]|uniref:glycoside hydrolase family 18 protein n=1 Tax=Tundrisphaera sp. TA3 TaxID=3435775 RepID=UPI003EBA63EC
MHRRIRPARLVALALALCVPAAGRAEEPAEKVFVGYLFGPPRDVDYKLYTHLCHAFLTADADGTIRLPRGADGAELTAKAHAEKVAVLLSLGGWGWDDQFRRIAADPAIEARYVDRVMEVIDRADYDGIDLDWEYPDTADEVAGFETLSRHFRERLDDLGKRKGRPMRLTMAASSNAGTLKWLDTAFLTRTYDWINVMTYDMAGDWTDYAGHNAPLFASTKAPRGRGPSTAATIAFLLDERKLPADKIALGLPLYGRAFAVAEPYAIKPKVAPKTKLPNGDYRNVHKLLAEGGWKRTWDDEAKVPWLIAPDRSAVIGFDDAESIATKTEWAMKKGLRGVFFWQIHGDRLPDGSNPLQAAALKAWRAGQGDKAP